MQQLENKSLHIKGLDTIRFLAALSVCIDHERPLSFIQYGENPSVLIRLVGGLGLGGWWFSGPCAVILFFVISGFCIHLPYFRGRKLDTKKFYIRRFVRIGLPLIPLYFFVKWIGMEMPIFGDSILWSIVCEEIYYSLYPGFMKLQKRLGWKKMIFLAYLLAFCVVATNPTAKIYSSYTNYFNWIVGLPCWFLGCYLAEIWEKEKVSRHSALLLRSGLFLLIILLPLLNFHSFLTYPLTLNFFALFVFFWLKKDLPYLQAATPPKFLEWAGKWSYSLYLLHMPLGLVLSRAGFSVLSGIQNHIIMYCGIFAGTLCFYYLFEKPSHRLAKKLSA